MEPAERAVVRSPVTLELGAATVTLIHDGVLDVPAGRLFAGVPRAVWHNELRETPADQLTLPVTVALVQCAGEIVLIDAGLGPVRTATNRGGLLRSALAALGIAPEAVTRVVVTHGHGDHTGGLLTPAGDGWVPAFPHALVHFPRADWEWIHRRPEPAMPALLASLAREGRVMLDEPEASITPWLRSLPTAGHSPGHRCLLLQAGRDGVCFLGDLVHDVGLHFQHPGWVTGFDYKPVLTPAARRRVAHAAVAGSWLLCAAHAPFPPLGRLVPLAGESWCWQPVRD